MLLLPNHIHLKVHYGRLEHYGLMTRDTAQSTRIGGKRIRLPPRRTLDRRRRHHMVVDGQRVDGCLSSRSQPRNNKYRFWLEVDAPEDQMPAGHCLSPNPSADLLHYVSLRFSLRDLGVCSRNENYRTLSPVSGSSILQPDVGKNYPASVGLRSISPFSDTNPEGS